MWKIVFHSVLNYRHIRQWFLCVANRNVVGHRSPVERRSSAADCVAALWHRLHNWHNVTDESVSVCSAAALCKDGWTDRGPVWGGVQCGITCKVRLCSKDVAKALSGCSWFAHCHQIWPHRLQRIESPDPLPQMWRSAGENIDQCIQC